jgi:elongation factor Tu
MSSDGITVRARIELLSAEQGGRTTPLVGGTSYRPVHNFLGPENRELAAGFIDLPTDQSPKPGETFEAEVKFLPSYITDAIKVGSAWRIQEGGQLVGFGTAIEIL